MLPTHIFAICINIRLPLNVSMTHIVLFLRKRLYLKSCLKNKNENVMCRVNNLFRCVVC